jgi:hypothetical protein
MWDSHGSDYEACPAMWLSTDNGGPTFLQNIMSPKSVTFMSVRGLFGAVRTSDYIALNVTMITELWTGNDAAGSGHDLIRSTIPAFA